MKLNWISVVLTAIILQFEFIGNAQLLHTAANCPTGTVDGQVKWSDPAGADEFDWPDRATSFTATNISGTEVDVTFAWSGQTGTFVDYSGINSPDIKTTLTAGEEALTYVTSGFTSGMTLTMTLSPAIPGHVGFEIYHMNKQGAAGDNYTISAVTTSGTTLYPTFSSNGTPSWTQTGPGVIDGNASSTAGQNDQVGVNFESDEYISTITMVWTNCNTCANNQLHGAAFGAFSFCIDDYDKDGIHNLNDEDDDNDGILDQDEQAGVSNPAGTLDWDTQNWPSGSLTGSFTVGAVTVSGEFSSTGSGFSEINEGTGYQGGLSPVQNALRYRVNQPSNDDLAYSIWTFSEPVDDLSFTLFDVDASGSNFRDRVTVLGYGKGEIIVANLISGPSNSVSESVATGVAGSSSTSSNGNVDVSFPELVDSVVIILGNAAGTNANPSTNGIAIHDFSWSRSAPQYDFDGDNSPNHLDIDSDNDGLFDLNESGLAIATINALDANNNGLIDPSTNVGTNGVANSIETSANSGTLNYTYANTDGDSQLNRYDLDSDGDGITDQAENGVGTDANQDGRIDGSSDVDGDGILSSADNDNSNVGSTLNNEFNDDGDLFANHMDIDSDNDGITDNVEAQATNSFDAPSGTDTDGDGWDNSYDPSNGGSYLVPNNDDGAGLPDYRDTDSDGDGRPDHVEGFDDDGNNRVVKEFMDRASAYETASGDVGHYTTTDTDGDGLANWLEDDNSNGVPNFLEPGNTHYRDTDNDGLINLYDTDNNGAASNLPDADGVNDVDFRDAATAPFPLPVELLSYKATKVKQSVVLHWTTSSEMNNEKFVVERSNDGETFSVIGEVKGNGTTNEQHTYELNDEVPFSGNNYYRLTQVDYDGKEGACGIRLVKFTGMKTVAKTIDVSTYPNPVKNELFILMNDELPENLTIQVIDATGKVVLNEERTEIDYSIQKVNVNSLNKGVYVLRLFAGENVIYNSTLVK